MESLAPTCTVITVVSLFAAGGATFASSPSPPSSPPGAGASPSVGARRKVSSTSMRRGWAAAYEGKVWYNASVSINAAAKLHHKGTAIVRKEK